MRREFRKYAIEFAIIFTSISLSFIVDEWRSNYQEKKVTKKFYQRLKAELEQKALNTQQYLENNKQLIEDNRRVSVNFKTREIPADSLFSYIFQSEHLGRLEPNLTTWESLKSTSAFTTVKPVIIDSVNSLLHLYKELSDNNEYLNNLYLQTWPQFLQDIPAKVVTEEWIRLFQKFKLPLGINPIAFSGGADMNKFLDNSIAVDYFFTKTLYAHGINRVYKYLPEKEKRLIALIENEINED